MLGHQLEDRNAGSSALVVLHLELAAQGWLHIGCIERPLFARTTIPNERLPFGIAHEETVIGLTRVVDHEPWSVGVAHEVVEIDRARLEQFVD